MATDTKIKHVPLFKSLRKMYQNMRTFLVLSEKDLPGYRERRPSTVTTKEINAKLKMIRESRR